MRFERTTILAGAAVLNRETKDEDIDAEISLLQITAGAGVIRCDARYSTLAGLCIVLIDLSKDDRAVRKRDVGTECVAYIDNWAVACHNDVHSNATGLERDMATGDTHVCGATGQLNNHATADGTCGLSEHGFAQGRRCALTGSAEVEIARRLTAAGPGLCWSSQHPSLDGSRRYGAVYSLEHGTKEDCFAARWST